METATASSTSSIARVWIRTRVYLASSNVSPRRSARQLAESVEVALENGQF